LKNTFGPGLTTVPGLEIAIVLALRKHWQGEGISRAVVRDRLGVTKTSEISRSKEGKQKTLNQKGLKVRGTGGEA